MLCRGNSVILRLASGSCNSSLGRSADAREKVACQIWLQDDSRDFGLFRLSAPVRGLPSKAVTDPCNRHFRYIS